MKNSLRTLLLSSAILAISAFAFAQAPAGAPGGRAGGAPGGMGGMPGGMGGGMPGGMGGMPGGMGGGMGGRMGGMGGGAPRQAGPPAEVPPQVAIPRPSADELTKIKAAVAQFIETSPEKDLLKKYPNLVTVTEPRANTAIAPVQTNVRNDQRHNQFVETANKGDFDILFHGDSITDWWQQSGKPVFDKHFGDMKVANFAIAGDTTQGLIWGLQNGEGKGNPKAIMLMIGTNNTGGNTGPEIAEGVGAVVLQLRKSFPNAKILLLAIFPRGARANDANRLKNDEANKIIAKLDDGKNIFFKNINDKFLKPDGTLIGFGGDNLHPNVEGYEIWANEVKDILKGWCK